ncbi:NADP-dependent phosphogluconate dehydrogenase [Candidatus Peregrinibacteria bacterium]|nr:MAG: NADP-dependent phosphogluconate dehydrogenase [Candidatus Peregrinibacteria bacterium]
MKKYPVGLIGLAVMGQNLARNLASKGFPVMTYNRTTQTAEEFIKAYGHEGLDFCTTLKDFLASLERPRKIILMVKAGAPVDETLNALLPFLEKGDVLIDGGNSNYHDTIRRSQSMPKGIEFVGMGVSGGEEGALRGPSLMPGCNKEAWKVIRPLMQKIAAKDFSGKPCVTHVGPDGAGHYIKMVHNGIEYAVMQMMAEAYDMLKRMYRLPPQRISTIFADYNQGKLKSFLFEIAVPVLSRKDDLKSGYLIDSILDKAGQKGTGRWVALDALEHGAALPTLTEAVYARSLSSFKKERLLLASLYKRTIPKPPIPLNEFIIVLENALYAGMISCYAQGFELIRITAEDQKWKLNFAEIARIWEGGCIIRADLLNFLHEAFLIEKGKPVHLFTIPSIRHALNKDIPSLRAITSVAVQYGVPALAFGTALGYFESMTSAILPAQFIQGLRDFFGAHTYERIDRKGSFHTPWSNLNL